MALLDEDTRIDASEVKEVFSTSMTDAQVNAFINAAHQIVVDTLASAGLSEAALTQIELFLSAHLCSLYDPRMERESVAGEYSYGVQGKTGMALDATFYGQMAKMFDTSGLLSSQAASLKAASITVLSESD